MSVLKSEWLKLVSVRTTWALLGAMIFIEGLAAGLTTSLGDVSDLRKRNVATLMPLTYLGDGLRQTMVGGAPFVPLPVDVAVLGGWLVVSLGISARYFRWQ